MQLPHLYLSVVIKKLEVAVVRMLTHSSERCKLVDPPNRCIAASHQKMLQFTLWTLVDRMMNQFFRIGP